jgi:hypothetical protein
MTPRRHLDDLFTSAYEDELSPIDEARFHAHIQSCEPCATAYAEFRTTIEALHELPKARMPHVVHLPSTAPVAERSPEHRLGWSRLNLGLLRRFPATALAGGFAVVLLIVALVHGVGGGSVATSSLPNTASSLPRAATAAACTHAYVPIAGAAPPVSYTQEDLATDAAQPALHLVLAAPTLQVTPGQQALVYAQFSAPVPEIAVPGAQAASPAARAVLPCVSVQVGTAANIPAIAAGAGAVQTPVAAPGANAGGPGLELGGSAGPLLYFQVPRGLAPGTEIHVIATIPANFTAPGSPPLTAELTLTTR